MQTVTRHGGASHYVRPDRVYRTGVITSTMGYQPGPDAQAVAASFTQYPMDLQVPSNGSSGVSGLRGLGRVLGATSNIGLFQRIKLRWDALRGRRALSGLGWISRAGMGQATGNARQTGVAYPQIGLSIMAPPFTQADVANTLMASGMDPGSAYAQTGYTTNWWMGRRWDS